MYINLPTVPQNILTVLITYSTRHSQCQLTFTCSKLTIETLEKVVKCVQS